MGDDRSGCVSVVVWLLVAAILIIWGGVLMGQEKPQIEASAGPDSGIANVTAVGQYVSHGYYYSYSQWFSLTYKLGACTWTQTVPVGPVRESGMIIFIFIISY